MDLESIEVLRFMDGDEKYENAINGILFRVAHAEKGEFLPIKCLPVALSLFPNVLVDVDTQTDVEVKNTGVQTDVVETHTNFAEGAPRKTWRKAEPMPKRLPLNNRAMR